VPKSHPNQNSFSRGELSPLMNGRSDTEIYNDGVKLLRNMYSDSRGAAKNRESLAHVLTLVAGTKVKIETYNRSSDEFFMIIITHLELRFIRNVINPEVTVFPAPWTVDQVEDIYFVPTPNGRIFYILHPNVQPQKLSDDLGVNTVVDFITSGNFTVPAGVSTISVCSSGGGGGGGGNGTLNNANSAWPSGGGGGGSGVVKANLIVTAAEVIPVIVGAKGIAGAKGVNGTDGGDSSVTAVSGSVTSLGGGGGGGGGTPPLNTTLPGGTAGIGRSGGGNGGKGSGTVSNSDELALDAIDGSDCIAVCGGGTWVGGKAGFRYTETIPNGGGGGGGGGGFGNGGAGNNLLGGTQSTAPNDNTSAGGGGGGTGAFGADNPALNGGSGKVTISYTVGGTGLALAPVVFINSPITWVDTNWPSCGTYHQSRLWLGGEPDFGESFYASITATTPADLENFDLGSGLDGDALSFILENFGRIEWIVTAKRLLMGTINGEYEVRSVGGVITTDDIQVDQQGTYGSASIQPVRLGDQVIFVTPDRRKVRAMNYEERKLNWMTVDLTLPSEHITKGLIKDLSWAQHPNNLLWATLDDGTMACLSYERGDNIYGWHRHDTQGKILGTGSGFNGVKSVLVAAVERTSGIIELEALNDNHYVDSWIQTSTFTPYTNSLGNDYFYVEGFDHLDGRAIQVTVDGIVHPDLIVKDESDPGEGDGATGRLYLDFNGSIAVAGLSYTPELTTLDMDGGSQTGSGAAHKKRYNKIYVDVLESGLPLINGRRGNDRNSKTPMDNKEKLITGTIEVVNSSDWDRFANVNIKQDLPLPLVILKIYGEVQKNSF